MEDCGRKTNQLPEFTESLRENVAIVKVFLELNTDYSLTDFLPSIVIRGRKDDTDGLTDQRYYLEPNVIGPLILYLFLLHGEEIYESGVFSLSCDEVRCLFSNDYCNDLVKSKKNVENGSLEDMILRFLTWDSVQIQYEKDAFNPMILIHSLRDVISAVGCKHPEARSASGEKLLFGAVSWIRKMVEDGWLHCYIKKDDGWYSEEWLDVVFLQLTEMIKSRESDEILYCGVPRMKWTHSILKKHLIDTDPSVVISAMTHIGKSVTIRPFTCVNPLVHIGNGVAIGSHSLIGTKVHIGENVRIGSGVCIGSIEGAGKAVGVVIEEGCEIGDKCVVGDNVILKRGAKLHPGTIFMAGTPIVGLPDRKSEESHSYGEVPEYTFIGQSTCDSKRMPGVHVPCVVVLEEE